MAKMIAMSLYLERFGVWGDVCSPGTSSWCAASMAVCFQGKAAEVVGWSACVIPTDFDRSSCGIARATLIGTVATLWQMSRELPLFPLGTVLFPGATLPLRIFENRYKEMLRHCLDNDRRFGVVLIR